MKSHLYVTHPRATWRAAFDVVRKLTSPPADVRECDARVAAVAADSAIGRMFDGAANAWRRASDDSWAAAAVRRATAPLVDGPISDRVRSAGIVAAIGSATTLALHVFATELDPFAWALPAIVGAIGVIAAAGAAPIARALDSYRS